MPSSLDTSDEKWFDNMEKGCIKLWNAVVVALQSLLQNPQNGERLNDVRLLFECCTAPVISWYYFRIIMKQTSRWSDSVLGECS